MSDAAGARSIEILLVEDNPDDRELALLAFEESKIANEIVVAEDGVEALDYLFGAGDSEGRELSEMPQLILLDLNLPKKDGREVLEEIKESPTLKSIPVVVLTTSASEADILRSYRLHANCFITKPVGLEGFLEVVKSIDSFWLSVVKLPREPRS